MGFRSFAPPNKSRTVVFFALESGMDDCPLGPSPRLAPPRFVPPCRDPPRPVSPDLAWPRLAPPRTASPVVCPGFGFDKYITCRIKNPHTPRVEPGMTGHGGATGRGWVGRSGAPKGLPTFHFDPPNTDLDRAGQLLRSTNIGNPM